MENIQIFNKKEIFKRIRTFVTNNPQGVLEILGPTASGKTDYAIKVAKKIGNAEIISVDSRQVYQDIDISSAKISAEEMQGVPHHGIDLVSPDEDFSVYDFQQYAFHKIAEIHSRGNIPILCGGTMLWLDAVSEHYIFSENKNEKSIQKGTQKWSFLKIGLSWNREKLYERINARAVQQFYSGLIEETRQVLEKYQVTKSVFTSFGYQEIKAYLDGDIDYEEALAQNQKRNRNYAKRQLTWWRGRGDVVWIDGQRN